MSSISRSGGRRHIATVLVVDDERSVTEGLSVVLRNEPYLVLSAQSGHQALSVLRQQRVDVVVSDEHMPGITGSELLRQVAVQFPETARVLLTGRPTLEIALHAINEGRVCRLLGKPCSPQELTRALSDAVEMALSGAAAARLLALARAETRREQNTLPPGARECGPGDMSGILGCRDMSALEPLSVREREVLALILDGQRVAQVASALHISQHTARNHLKSIFAKLGVHSQAELLARSRGLPWPV